ncbi:MAG: bifunctional phosphopantothenoylcysteine decarboxylase/phosphopantothenate--cysteine ligase CoaBC [Alteromonadaceae bacterium]|nr:MAG: bifunctional phosphopantothenoylcysteine decarboxylase/phosphopantothenate--cysteine ligase CoaBC [Alteromonadaceae bacterium]
MTSLNSKKILLGITGGIAAYKSAELVRRLSGQGAEVRVVMTEAAQKFITPLTMQALSGNPVSAELLDPAAEAGMGHIELAKWADLILIAPATASFMSKLAVGDASDLLMTLCLATVAPIVIAPAMNQAMWSNVATQANLSTLKNRNVAVLGPASGGQACGDVGFGRMLEPEDIVDGLSSLWAPGALSGKKVVITAGPTREAIDPVRYISNHSSGKMGYALAQAAVEAGASVVLVSGPVSLEVDPNVRLVSVVSALQMHEQAVAEAAGADMFIGAAAVADFRPVDVAAEKIKKGSSDSMSISMVKNPDIIASVAALVSRPFTVGFAAETQNVTQYAKDKLARKGLDMIIANDVSNARIGFNSDSNAVTVIDAQQSQNFDERSKQQLARDLVAYIAQVMARCS